ncbi:MAG TPA: hypothetical protein PKX05_05510, partial [bacterium]|nr:hypothetical protein [bacterium]
IIIIAGPNGEDEGKIRDLIQQKDYTFEVLVNKKADVGFADTSLFTIFLIDKKGIVRAGYPIQSFVVNVNIVKEIEPIISDKTKNPPTILTKYLKNLAKDYKNSFAKNFHYPSLEEYTECWEQEMELHKAELEKVYSPKQLETIKKIIPLTYISKKEREMLIPQEACKWALRKAIDLAEDETIPLQVKKRCGFIESANNIKNNPSLKKTFNYDDVDLSLFNGNNYIMECLRKDIPVELACWNSQIAQEVLHRYNIDPDGSYTQQEKAEIEKILIKENVPKETAPAYYICEDWVNDCYIYAYLRVKEKNLRKIAGLLGIKFEAFVKDLTATQYEAILNLDILASPEFTSLEKDITPPPGSRIYFLSQSLLKPSHIQLGLGRFGFITNGYFNPDSSRATAPFPYTSYHGWTIPCFLVNSFIFNVSK